MAHGDYTGNTKAELATRYARQEQFRATETDLIRKAATESRVNTVIDLFVDTDSTPPATTRYNEDGDIALVPLEDPRNNPVKFRASETLDEVTVGKDRTFNLEAGQTYRAPRWVVEHLDEKHLVRN